MNEKSPRDVAFYATQGVLDEGGESLVATRWTAGPWSSSAQHGGPPAALLTRAVERLPEAVDRVVGRITVDLLGPVPVGALRSTARVLRPGRSVVLAEAELVDPESGRVVVRATAWLFPRSTQGPATTWPRLEHGPEDGFDLERPDTWSGGYLDAVAWRWIAGSLDRPGPGVVWMRSPQVVAGERPTGLQRLLACVDSASGVSSELDVREWRFLNTDLTVHVLREPVGEWLCLDAVTTLAGTASGVCAATVHDRDGLVARSAQALLVVPRRA